MFIWILVVVILVAFLVYNWAELGQRMRGTHHWMLWFWPGAALGVWLVALEVLRLHQIIALILLLLVLGLGYYQLRRSYPSPKRPALQRKAHSKRHRRRKHR